MDTPVSQKVHEFQKTHPEKRKGPYTAQELQNIKTWVWPVWLVNDGSPQGVENGHLLNAGIRWLACEMNHENLNTLCQSSELIKLLNVIRPPEPHVVTPEERTEGEEELAKAEKSWRGEGRIDGPESAPFTVCYNSVDNLDKICAYVNTELLGVAAKESFVLAFRMLLSKGELVPMKKEQRPTHNPPATPASVRADRKADEKKHAETRQSVQQIRDMRRQFESDYDTVVNYRGTPLPGGMISHAATYTGQLLGYTKLKAKWNGKFQGGELKIYQELMADLSSRIERRNSSGGAIKINDKNDKPNEYRGGGSISDAPVTAESEAARQERNRQILSGSISNPKKPTDAA